MIKFKKEKYLKLVKEAYNDKKESCKQCNGECFNCLWDRDALCIQIRKELFDK